MCRTLHLINPLPRWWYVLQAFVCLSTWTLPVVLHVQDKSRGCSSGRSLFRLLHSFYMPTHFWVNLFTFFFLLGMQALDLGTYFDVFFCCQIEEIDTLSHDSWRLYGEDESCIWRNRNQAQTVWEVSNIIGKRKGYVTGCSSFLWWFFFSFSWVAKQVVGREGPSGSRSLNCLANVYYIHCKA